MMMIKKLARKILQHELDSMTDTIESLRDSNNALRNEVDGFADIKLRLRVAELYIDDNDAIDEILAAKKEEETVEQKYSGLRSIAAAQGMQGGVGMFGSSFDALSDNLLGGRYG